MSQIMQENATLFPVPKHNQNNSLIPNLTTGCLEHIFRGEPHPQPILQVVAIKPFTNTTSDDSANNANQRYRLILSDGAYFVQATISNTLSLMVQQEKIKKGAIVEVTGYTVNSVKSKIILVISLLKVIVEMSSKIGAPKNLETFLTDGVQRSESDQSELKTQSTMNTIHNNNNNINNGNNLNALNLEARKSPPPSSVQIKIGNDNNQEQQQLHLQQQNENYAKAQRQKLQQQLKQQNEVINHNNSNNTQPRENSSQMAKRNNVPPPPTSNSSSSSSSSSFSKREDNSQNSKSHRQPFVPPSKSSRIIPFGSAKPLPNKSRHSVSEDETLSLFPIEGLNPYQHKWKIRARLISKSEKKSWGSDKGAGELFSADFIDETGEIRATAFNKAVDKFYNFLEVNKVYYISNATIKPANKKFSNIKNEYEMQLDTNTEITICEDVKNVPTVKYEIMKIDEIEKCEANKTVDVIGIAIEIEEIGQITKNAKELIKRTITIMDDSEASIKLTLWGKNAEELNEGLQNSIILVKGAKVGNFGGKSLSTIQSSIVLVDPDIEEAYQLKGWHQSISRNTQNFNLKSLTSNSSSSSSSNYPRKRLIQIQEENLGQTENKSDFFSVKATITSISKDGNISYTCCIAEKCGKKVIPAANKWYCDKCKVEYDECEQKYTLSMGISDMSGQTWTRGFGGVGEVIMCVKASELVEFKKDHPTYYEYVFQEALFRDYIFNMRAKTDEFEGNSRVNVTIAAAIPIDYVAESKKLIQGLRS